MTVDTTGSSAVLFGFDPVIYARKTCGDTSTQLACNDATPPAVDRIDLPVTAGETYYLFIDGYDSSSGSYQVNVKVVPPACGNTTLEPPEECDDGNLADGDGCSHLCKLEGGPNDQCPGTVLTLSPSGPDWVGSATGSTVGLAADYNGTCGQSAASQDAVYQFNSGPGGLVTATFTAASFDTVVYARSGDCAAGTQLGCKDVNGNGGEVLTFNAAPNTNYWLFVDGYNGHSGTFTLGVKVGQAVCGNNAVEGTEQCDDGNLLDNDGCSHLCMFEPAGPNDVCDGQLVTLTQVGASWVGSATGTTINLAANYAGSCGSSSNARDAVYRFNSGPGGSVTASLPTASFDAVLYAHGAPCATGPELACDDAVSDGGDLITFSAVPNTEYYVIVDGYSAEYGTFTLDLTVTPAACGNGTVEGTEQCDDSNLIPNDGCSATCQFEGTCGLIVEAEPNPYATPQVIPSACGTFLIPSASMPLSDADYFQVDLYAGTTMLASTFVGSPGACDSTADTVLSLWNAPMAATNESGACSTTGYLQCNDQGSNSPCSTINYTVAATGTYVLKVHNYYASKAIPSYGLAVTIQ